MKPRTLIILAVVLLAPIAFAQNKVALKVTVEKQQKTRHQVTQKGKAQTSGNVTMYTPQVTKQDREVSFNINVQYLGARELKGLKVKYIIFSRDKGTNAVRPAGKGEREIESLKSLEIRTVETDPVNFESQDVSFNQGFGGEYNSKSGKEYHGVAVAVYSGGERVATYFSPSALNRVVEEQKLDL